MSEPLQVTGCVVHFILKGWKETEHFTLTVNRQPEVGDFIEFPLARQADWVVEEIVTGGYFGIQHVTATPQTEEGTT